jgi:UPF0148 protein
MGADVKRMSELLKSGAAMLSETCPECGTPLFKLGNDVICPKCNRTVVIIKGPEDEAKLATGQALENTEQIVLAKIQETNASIKNERDPDRLLQLGNLLASWLEALEKVRKLKASATENA